MCACACVTRLPQTANLIWRRRVSVCHLFPVHRQERTANIDTDKSIVSDIPVPRCRDGDGGDTADFSGANNRAPMPSYRRSSMTLPWSSPPPPPPRFASWSFADVVPARSLLQRDNPGQRPSPLLSRARCALSEQELTSWRGPSEMFGSTVRRAEILPCPDSPDLHRTSVVIHSQLRPPRLCNLQAPPQRPEI